MLHGDWARGQIRLRNCIGDLQTLMKSSGRPSSEGISQRGAEEDRDTPHG
jgi:hypothetical protein